MGATRWPAGSRAAQWSNGARVPRQMGPQSWQAIWEHATTGLAAIQAEQANKSCALSGAAGGGKPPNRPPKWCAQGSCLSTVHRAVSSVHCSSAAVLRSAGRAKGVPKRSAAAAATILCH